MSTVSSRSSHRYSTHSSAASVNSTGTVRRLSSVLYSTSPVTSRFPDSRLSVTPREAQQQSRPRSANDDQSTEMITIALAKAQNAVLLDQRNNVTGALDGYSQCCAILAEVIAKETDSDDITRLRQIHDTYSVRMHVLSTMQLDPNSTREMPPLPTQADLEEFEDEEDEQEILQQFAQTRLPASDPDPARYSDYTATNLPQSRPTSHRTSSSRDLNGISRPPPSSSTATAGTSRKYAHSRTSSYLRSYSQEGNNMTNMTSLEQIPVKPSYAPPKKESISLLPEMSEEEMDDAAFLERITRGFTSEEEILFEEREEEPRPSTGSTVSSQTGQQRQSKKLPETFNFDSLSAPKLEGEDYVLPSPRSGPRQPTPPLKPKHDRARNTSSPLPQPSVPRPSSAKKNLSVSGAQAQPMSKSLSANNAIPNADEMIVPGNVVDEAVPAVPPKIKKRPQLIRVVSESTMRSNYGGSRSSTFELSPVSPASAGSLITPGTSISMGFQSETSPTAVRNAITQDREGCSPPEPPPEDPYHRPYWLMRSIVASMRSPKGAYLTQKLFIPQAVWSTKNVKIKSSEEKMNCVHTMTMAVKQVLEADDRNIPLLLQEVASLEGTMDNLQQNLQRKLDGKQNGQNGTNGDSKAMLMSRKMSQVSPIPPPSSSCLPCDSYRQSTLLGGWGKRLRSKSSASSTIGSMTSPSGKDFGIDAAYPNAILVLFECALFLEQKFESLDPEDMPIKTQLRLEASRRRIAEFFANIVIRFVLQDLGSMMNKYVKRVNDWMAG